MSDNYFSIEDFYEEINSHAFLDGAREAIRQTQRTHYETSFELDYVLDKGFFYPENIWVGDEDTVLSKPNPKRIALAKEKYYRETGLAISDYPSEEELEKFERFLRRNPRLMDSMDYPISIDYIKKSKDFPEILDKESSKIVYDLINFHTHPGSSFFPSGTDLDWLSFTRTRNKIKGINPISIIVAVPYYFSTRKRKFPAFVIQQQFPLHSPLCYDLEKSSQCLHTLVKRPSAAKESLLVRIAKEAYDFRIGSFVVGKGFYFEE